MWLCRCAPASLSKPEQYFYGTLNMVPDCRYSAQSCLGGCIRAANHTYDSKSRIGCSRNKSLHCCGSLRLFPSVLPRNKVVCCSSIQTFLGSFKHHQYCCSSSLLGSTASKPNMWGSLGLNTQTLKNGLRKYGRAGIVTYLGLSTMVTTGFYIAIKENVDVKKLVGIKENDPDSEPSAIQKMLLGPGSHIALAILCSKACIPLKLPVAMALTPYVHRLEQRFFHRAVQQAAQQTQQHGRQQQHGW